MLERLRLLLELRVGLLELGLLVLQALLRLLERAALLLELLVADAELLLLRLELLGLPLRLLEQVLEVLRYSPIAARRRWAPRRGGGAPALRLDRPEEAELDDRVRHAVGARVGEEQVPRLRLAEARRHREVVVGHVAHLEDPIVPERLRRQPAGRRGSERRKRGRVRRHRLELARGRGEVDRAHHGAQILGEKRRDLLADAFDVLVPLHPSREVGLPLAQPRVHLLLAKVARRDDDRSADEKNEQGRPAPDDVRRDGRRFVPLLRALVELLPLEVHRVRGERARLVHRVFAAIGEHEGERGLRVPGALQVDRLFELGELVVREARQRVEALQLRGVGRHRAPGRVDDARERDHGVAVGREVPLFPVR